MTDKMLEKIVCDYLGIEPRKQWMVGWQPMSARQRELLTMAVRYYESACGGSPAFVAELKDLENTLLATLPEPPKQAAEEAAKR